MNKKWGYLSDKFNNKDNLYGEQLPNFSTKKSTFMSL